MPDEVKRGRGRPRRYAPGRRPTLTFRVSEEVHHKLAAAAEAAQRSISEEIEFRLNRDFAWEATKGDIEKDRAAIKALREAARVQALREAGHQITREAGGVLVTVIPEELEAIADGILRSGFGDPQHLNKSASEVIAEARPATRQDLNEAIARIENLLNAAGLLSRKGAA